MGVSRAGSGATAPASSLLGYDVPNVALPAVRIRARDRDAVLRSLRAGVVPQVGQHLIQVGRASEVSALIEDIDRVAGGGVSIRLVVGDYGSGKSFFLHLVRSIALANKLVAVHADLSPDHRLRGTDGQARRLYAELMRNMSTRSRPDGGAIHQVVGRFVTTALSEARSSGGEISVEDVIFRRLASLEELAGGYAFADVIRTYWRAYDTTNDALRSAAVRWLRAEFTTRTDARASLGVRDIIDDANAYDYLKVLALFVRLAGFDGLLVCLDEMVNLYKLPLARARETNYEQVLRILNDCLQGSVGGMGFLFGLTTESLTDTRRGLFSYPALQTRLSENPYARGGLVDYAGPVLHMPNLRPEDIFVLLSKLRHLYASGDQDAYLLPDVGLVAFMEHCQARVGDAYFRTPRSTIKEFVGLLAVLDQNPDASWRDLIARIEIAEERDDELTTVDL